MKQYFSIDSTIFTIVSIVSIIVGSPAWLMILSIFTMIVLVIKSRVLNKGDKNYNEDTLNTFSYILLFVISVGISIFGFFSVGFALFVFWFYMLKHYLK